MKENDIVEVLPSCELKEIKLEALAGYKGKIVETFYRANGTMRGAIVAFPIPYLDECEWYIPEQSLYKLL